MRFFYTMALLLVIQGFVALALIGVILIQKAESSGLGLGGGGNNNVFTARGAANLFTRITAILAAVFMGLCLLMSIISARSVKQNASILQPTAQTSSADEASDKDAPSDQ
jgi:preprotein translocase subunit SecG